MELLILVLVGAIIVTSFADKRGMQPALIIIVVGLAVSFIPGVPHVELESEILLTVVLPPLLYSAALGFSFANFVRNIRPILGLGVAMVVITAFVVGFVTSAIVPEFTFTLALLLGAIVAPPDAVTAVAIGRKLGLPKRLMSILTGESLVNDAAALSLFAIAISQIASTHSFIENPLALFGYNAVVGPIVGLVVGFATLWIRRHLANPALETVQGFVVPFAAFVGAEHIHSSGVLAVVIAGFVVGSGSVRAGYKTRLQERYVWHSVDVLLEAFVFAYIGLQMRFIIEDLREAKESLVHIAWASVLVLVIVLAIRPICVFVMFGRAAVSRRIEAAVNVDTPANPRRTTPSAGRPDKPKKTSRWAGKIDRRTLTWQESTVIAWTGMRGVVTLAAASGIPLTVADGTDFPERSAIIAIAFVVTIGTIGIQATTLPWMIARLHLRNEDEERYDYEQTALAEKIAHRASADVLDEFVANPPEGLDGETIAVIHGTVARQSHDAEEMPDPEKHNRRNDAFIKLYLDVLAAQRAALVVDRDEGKIEDEAVRAMLERLDLQEASLSARMESRF
ncbi:sodium:proton antiporter [Gordonia amarae]|uniref:Sodium:proton antiporter n=2 Tax=Gordonia amarae TaxID=36821 RepID=A0A857L2E7_9ACTN|nr:sodium:proton antiporter [Gordonia amarae]MCS3876400.1 CPA1 family monovalent cation:H+ antiporter [Gordonia amarae]QHN19317.1 sodium:proton antiporter [Gordonia amarae]QHN23793.1 sodium:proton antiporter [Gordonia amarae]QHN32703.1 sodium:proton antiporter [Gordonia amarae]QHN41452.1 sodium:proton antiporter [Gordonia amarae]